MTQIRPAEQEKVFTWQDAMNHAASVLNSAEHAAFNRGSAGERALVAMGWVQLATEIRGWQRP